MTQHTPGPWAQNGNLIEGPDGETVAYFMAYNTMTPRQKANARRIVACVNACAGMTNEQLDNICMISGSLLNRFGEQMHYLGQVEQQRDELLAALENVMANPTTFSFEPIRAAIAKATGEEK